MQENNMPSLSSNTYLFNLILLFAFDGLVLRVMVFNATFNNTSVAVGFIGGTGKPEKPTDVP
jgi:hypothetical protein